MSNESEYDNDFYDWFAEMLITQGCSEEQAKMLVEEMKKPPKHTYGDLTVRELWRICISHPQCKDCPLEDPDMCIAAICPNFGAAKDREVDL